MILRNWLKTASAIGLFVGWATAATAQQNTVDGTVEKIDKGASKITLKHGAIKNLDMDGMTMVFRVPDPSVLDKLKVGQRVKFEADRINGQLSVTRIEAAK